MEQQIRKTRNTPSRKNYSDYVGKIFGRLTVVGFSAKKVQGKDSVFTFNCICKCGVMRKIIARSVYSGITQSCGCLQQESATRTFTRHGLYRSRESKILTGIKGRCYNDKNTNYYNYGGRGIVVCDRWLESVENFIEDMGCRPSKKPLS